MVAPPYTLSYIGTLPIQTNQPLILHTKTDLTVCLHLLNPTAPSPSPLSVSHLCTYCSCMSQIFSIQLQGVVPVLQQHLQLQCPQGMLACRQYWARQHWHPCQWVCSSIVYCGVIVIAVRDILCMFSLWPWKSEWVLLSVNLSVSLSLM